MADLNRRLMYRPHQKNRIETNDIEHEWWPFLIEIQGTKNKCDWGQLIAQVWADSENPEYYARLFAAAPRMLAALRAIVDDQTEESIQKAKDAIDDATIRTSCPTCKGSTENRPCKTCDNTGMIQ